MRAARASLSAFLSVDLEHIPQQAWYLAYNVHQTPLLAPLQLMASRNASGAQPTLSLTHQGLTLSNHANHAALQAHILRLVWSPARHAPSTSTSPRMVRPVASSVPPTRRRPGQGHLVQRPAHLCTATQASVKMVACVSLRTTTLSATVQQASQDSSVRLT